jgi:dTDP-4-amino-4,6-dideoxygalactose transaminase
MGIDLFGQPCDMLELKKICNKHNLKFICDSAQSIGAKYKNNYSSTYADVGGYSLNFHKHINTGEGGIIITNNKKIAHKCRLIRNHAEVTVGKSNSRELVNMIGYNFRLTEIQAAIGIEQLKKLKKIIKKKTEIANYLSKNLSKLPGLEIPYLKKNRTHVYYSYPMKINSEITKIHRDKIWKMLLVEGVPVNNKIPCLHLLPMFQKQIAFGNNNYPWNKNRKYKGIYKRGTLPIAEKLSDNSILCLQMWAYDFTKKDLDKIINIFFKVWKKLELI